MSRQIRVKVSPTGEITVEAYGFKGNGCETATKAIEEALGTKVSSRRKSDWWSHLTKAARDGLLERFVAEDLVRIDGKMVTATTYGEFVSGLYARKEFPVPEDHLDKINKAVAPVA